MSDTNPYQSGLGTPVGAQPGSTLAPAGSGVPFDESLIRKVRIQPIALMQRAYAFLGDAYGLFLGLTLVSVLVGSLVPMGLITGALTVGVFLCLLEHEAGRRVEFSLIFKGFEYFVDSLIVVVAILILSFVIILPLTLLMMALMFGGILALEGNGESPAGVLMMIVTMVIFTVAIMAASVLIYLPFLFSFQLIADQKLKATDALWLGWAGSKKNFGGLVLLMLVFSLIGLVGAMLCYIPLILFMPIAFTSMFLLYRDIYAEIPTPPAAAEAVPVTTPAD